MFLFVLLGCWVCVVCVCCLWFVLVLLDWVGLIDCLGWCLGFFVGRLWFVLVVLWWSVFGCFVRLLIGFGSWVLCYGKYCVVFGYCWYWWWKFWWLVVWCVGWVWFLGFVCWLFVVMFGWLVLVLFVFLVVWLGCCVFVIVLGSVGWFCWRSFLGKCWVVLGCLVDCCLGGWLVFWVFVGFLGLECVFSIFVVWFGFCLGVYGCCLGGVWLGIFWCVWKRWRLVFLWYWLVIVKWKCSGCVCFGSCC